MKAHELQIVPYKDRKRVGRGISAGGGKTAGRGTKGQKARTGKKLRAGFEGGQLPLMKRIPKKKGFRSIRVPAQVVYTFQLEGMKTVDAQSLTAAGLITTPYHAVKVVVKGKLQSVGAVKLSGATGGAIEAIKAAGGTFEKVATTRKQASQKTEKEA